ncbi:hypothetical protein F53441_12746 [Fusarium austroafricanum]|uniref:Uncharacterized protein n=1 Tax=Fusarium austroafricanum TaxID=2364996 RepID=A0A8H4JX17_9HYPO|nr:hypothetical protein F53441_12746 [Fusarium austroafricanum]
MLAATRIWTSERLLQSRAAPSNVLRSSVSLQSRCKQCRSYSPVVSSSSSSQFRNGRRRGSVRFQQSLLKRNLSWEAKSKAALQKAARGSHRSADPIKFASIGQVKTWASDLLGIRPGANIEDVERSAIDHLFRGDKKANILKATSTHAHHFSRPTPNAATPKDTLFSAVHGQDSTFIDPITNRRVTKSSTAGTAARFEEKRDYEPTDFVNVSVEADSTPKYDDLDKYKPTKDIETEQHDQPKYDDLDKYEPVIDERPAQEQPVEYDDLDKYGPVKHNEPDGKRPTTAEEDSKQYKDLDKYASTGLDDPLAKRQMTAEEQSKLYDDLDQYKPVYYNEPDGKRAQTTEELSKNYDDLDKYGAVYWNEPDGLREPTPEELSKNYKDLSSYGPVTYNEPDGLRRLTPEEESKKYDDLDSYANPFDASQSVLKAHEKAQMDTTMRGKPLAPKVDAPAEDFASKYDDLHKYGPVHWNEPDGLREPTPEELSKNYDDLHLYGAVRHNEPDGLRPLTAEEMSKHYKDTHMYAARDLSPPVERVHPEEASKAYKDIPGYHNFENADSPARIHPEEASKKYADLGAYASFENDGQTERMHPEEASKQYKDLYKYPSVGFEEAIRVKHVHPEELTKHYTDLGSYRPSGFVSQAQAYPVNPEEASKVYQDLHKYNAVRHNEPNGKMSIPLDEVARGLREFDSKAGSQDSPDTTPNTYGTPNRSTPGSTETKIDPVDPESAEAIRAAVLRRAYENSQRAKSQSLSGTKDQVESQLSSSGPKLTGNYTRDFPEDFVTSWSKDNSPSKSALCPNNYSGKLAPVKEVSNATEDDVEPGSMDESFPIEDSKLQPALDRYTGRVYKDHYSHVPQGLQTSYSEECGRSTMPVMEKHYAQQKAKAMDKPNEKPNTVSYKILAFDPTSKMMSVAQVNSVVGANDSPMAVPDALVKLAHPAKFLPYFKSLQNQGYEVISGSAHMLVFRQMRPASESPNVGGSTFDDMVSRGGVFSTSDDTQGPKDQRSKPSKKRRIGRNVLMGTVGVAAMTYAAAMVTKDLNTKGQGNKIQQKRQE